MYDISRVNANDYFDTMDAKARYKLKENLNNQHTKDFKNGTFGYPKSSQAMNHNIKDYFDYYKMLRGFHAHSINSNGNWNLTSSLSFLNMPILTYNDEIENAVLIIHGDKAHSKYLSQDAYKKLKGKNKELLLIKDANHMDLYDNAQKIPFDKIEAFFNANLK